MKRCIAILALFASAYHGHCLRVRSEKIHEFQDTHAFGRQQTTARTLRGGNPLTTLACLLLAASPAAGFAPMMPVSKVLTHPHKSALSLNSGPPFRSMPPKPYVRLTQLSMTSDENREGEQAEGGEAKKESTRTDDLVKFKLAHNMKQQWLKSYADLKVRPISYLMIPIVSAIVGYITNLVGVKMLFLPTQWQGIPLLRFPEQPFGWLGWQGVVPAKRYQMADKMVDVTISKLLDVQEVCNRLDPRQLARILEPDVRDKILGGFMPAFITRFFLQMSCRSVIARATEILNIRRLVVSGLTKDATTLANFFQDVGRKELNFLVNSGFGVGFVLGIFQLVQWMLFPKGWTLPASGAVVGYITNWVALKWIFQPLDPMQIGPFRLQGKFLTRQNEVSEQFSEYIARETLSSKRLWADILGGQNTDLFTQTVNSKLPLPRKQVEHIVGHLKDTVGNGADHALHAYTDGALAIRSTLGAKMKAMSTKEFEQVLHPIFQEDELTLILAGAVLGAMAGGLQWLFNDKIDDFFNGVQKKFVKWRAKRSRNQPLPSASDDPTPPNVSASDDPTPPNVSKSGLDTE